MLFSASELAQLCRLDLSFARLDDYSRLPPRVTHLDLMVSSLSDHHMPSIARLTRLEFLSIQDTEVRDEGMKCLLALTELRTLRVGKFQQPYVTTRSLSVLSKLSKLRSLRVYAQNEEAEFISALSACERLDELSVNLWTKPQQ